ncbi:oxidoreductase [Lithospermum erythrorhizon]|uniref:Oxidoreductase n=1 Tax=Lithospermum erythrorhizon TaxID=34254 RepID=A0AAV3R4H8_LITER
MAEICLPKKKLDNKVAIITGGASGIGEATARLFANNGVRAVVIADIQDDLGQKVAESIGSNICRYYHCDVSDEEQVKSMVEFTVQKYGRLDIMFSNAGTYSTSQTIMDFDLSKMDLVFSVNVGGMASCVKYAARVMTELKIRGSVVCTASMGGSVGGERFTDYFMSKHAVIGLMKCASKQLGEFGIRVNTVSPFAVATPIMVSSMNKNIEEIEKMFQPLTSLKDVVMKTKHVADAVLFLASDDSAFITGHDLKIDGGFSA